MQKDYIMRMIEQMVEVLAAIIIKAETGHYQEAREDLDKVCRETVGLDLERVKTLAPDAVGDLLKTAGSLSHTRSIMLAEILLSEAQVVKQQEYLPFPLANYVHASCLISDALPMMGHDDEARYRAKLKELVPLLAPYKDMPQLSERLAKFQSIQ